MKLKVLLSLAMCALFAQADVCNGAINPVDKATVEVETTFKDGTTKSEFFDLKFKDSKADFVYSKDCISADVKSILVKPSFCRVKFGTDGYWMTGDNDLGYFKERANQVECDTGFWGVIHMPFFGMKLPNMTFVAIMKGMPYACTMRREVKDGYYMIYPYYYRRMDKAYEDISITFTLLNGEEADYSGMCRAYRKYQNDRGEIVPLKERVKESKELEYAVRWPEVRVRMAWKPVPSPEKHQVIENEPAVFPAIPFDRFKEIVGEFKAQGIGGAEFCLVGWNIGGHDGRWPQIFPVEPSLGGEQRLRDAIKYAQDNGYQVVGHGNHRDAYMIADCWDLEYLVDRDEDGRRIIPPYTWGGGAMHEVCAQRAYERFASKDLYRVRALGFKGLYYLDVYTCVPPPHCDDPRHPLNEREATKYIGFIFDQCRDVFGGSASEGAWDHNIKNIDSTLYVSFMRPFEKQKGLADRYIPAYQIVYNGVVLSNPFTTTVNAMIKGRDNELKLIEFGGRPTFYYYANFRSPEVKIVDGKRVVETYNWMGDEDLPCRNIADIVDSVGKIKRGISAYDKLWKLQYSFMDHHDEVESGVFCTRYSTGERVYVNYNDKDVTLKNGVSIPAKDWVLK